MDWAYTQNWFLQTWLQREVYNTEIQWELLLEDVENPKSKLII